ncbi:replication initiator protein [Capybara microvirus Cap1_SP_52]|nr:replication initiator protein [Capybara microvirus Cap1_SP_52]
MSLCLKPIKIWQNNRERTVSCGHCAHCINAKHIRNKQLVELESNSHPYELFCTLTYDDYHVPKVHYSHTNKLSSIESEDIFEFTNSRFKDEVCKGRFAVPNYYLKDVHSINMRQQLFNGEIRTLNYVDLRLYLQRVRQALRRSLGTNVRFYAVGEYGPKKYRPHYHIIFWCDDLASRDWLLVNALSYWPYGTQIEIEQSRKKLDSYLAGYVNSETMLPPFFSCLKSPMRPKAYHSNFLGQTYPFAYLSVMFHSDPGKKFELFKTTKGIYDTIPKAIFDYFYRKLPNYQNLDNHEKTTLYKLFNVMYDYRQKQVGENIPLENYKFSAFLEDLKDFERNEFYIINLLGIDDFFEYLKPLEVNYEYKCVGENLLTYRWHPKLISLYRVFSIGKFYFWLSDITSINYNTLIDKVIYYFDKEQPQQMLANFFSNIETLPDISPQDLSFLYNLDDDYKDSKLYQCIKTHAIEVANDNVKHKKENDGLKI